MTRTYVYTISLLILVAATTLTITSIALPRWISFHSTSPSGTPITYHYGLHRRCSSASGTCTHFPTKEECHGQDARYFCSMWRSVGFLMSLAVVLEGMCVVAFLVVMAGGRQKRVQGWKWVAGLTGLVAVVQCAGMAMVAFLYDWDDRFFAGWSLDLSWIFTTVSWAVIFCVSMAMVACGVLLPPEDGYELIQ